DLDRRVAPQAVQIILEVRWPQGKQELKAQEVPVVSLAGDLHAKAEGRAVVQLVILLGVLDHDNGVVPVHGGNDRAPACIGKYAPLGPRVQPEPGQGIATAEENGQRSGCAAMQLNAEPAIVKACSQSHAPLRTWWGCNRLPGRGLVLCVDG